MAATADKLAAHAAVPTTGLLAELELARASVAARAAGVDLATWLVDRVGMSPADMRQALAAHFGCPFVELDEHARMPDTLRASSRPQFLRDLCAAPIARHDSCTTVVMEDPSNLTHVDLLHALVGKDRLLL